MNDEERIFKMAKKFKQIKQETLNNKIRIASMLARPGPPEWESAKKMMCSEIAQHMNTLRRNILDIINHE